MFIEYNPNPIARNDTGDCVIRAVSKALNISWEEAYIRLCISGFAMGDLPNSDSVFGAVLRMNGFKKKALPDACPDCYTVANFAIDHPYGTYVLGLGGHAVAVIDGDIYDAWDSSKGIPVYYWYKDDNERLNYDKSEFLRSEPAVLGDPEQSSSDDTPAANTAANKPVPNGKPADSPAK